MLLINLKRSLEIKISYYPLSTLSFLSFFPENLYLIVILLHIHTHSSRREKWNCQEVKFKLQRCMKLHSSLSLSLLHGERNATTYTGESEGRTKTNKICLVIKLSLWKITKSFSLALSLLLASSKEWGAPTRRCDDDGRRTLNSEHMIFSNIICDM